MTRHIELHSNDMLYKNHMFLPVSMEDLIRHSQNVAPHLCLCLGLQKDKGEVCHQPRQFSLHNFIEYHPFLHH